MYNLKEIRIKQGFTQEEVARFADITLRNYIYIENKEVEPKVTTALKICRILNIDPRNVDWTTKKRAITRYPNL